MALPRSTAPHSSAEQDDPDPVQTAVSPAQPLVWLVLGDKRGDNAQVEIAAQALGWQCERKHLEMLPPYVFGKPRVEPSLHHIDLARSSTLEPPWPDLILTIGRRPSMAALWIREQSGRRTKIVLFGKPSGRMKEFDLIIASGENLLPPLPNVLPITLPLMRMDQADLDAAAAAWRARFAPLPRPLIALLIGGPTGPFVFDATVTTRLLDTAAQITATGGTAYFTTSRRTPAKTVAELQAKLPPGAHLFPWQADATDNPYRALLALADGFVVTGDSISMMVEIVRLGRPLAIFSLPTSRLGALDQIRRSVTGQIFAPPANGRASDFRRRIATALFRAGICGYTRDFQGFHRRLCDQRLAVPDGLPTITPASPAQDDLDIVTHHIRRLASIT